MTNAIQCEKIAQAYAIYLKAKEKAWSVYCKKLKQIETEVERR